MCFIPLAVWRWFGNELENFIAPTATLRLSDSGDFWGVTFDVSVHEVLTPNVVD